MIKKSASHLLYRLINGRPIVQILATFISNISALASGMHASWTSPSLPKMYKEDTQIHITKEMGSWITTILMLGGFTGSVLSIFLLSKMGRKQVILLTAIPYIVAWLFIALATTGVHVPMARFFAGVSDGLTFSCVPIYIGEIAQPNVRGFLGSMPSVFYIVGMLLINVMGSYLSISTVAYIGLVFPVALLLLFPSMPESPYYCIMKENHEDAKKFLKILRSQGDVDSELQRITEAVRDQTKNSGKYMDLFTVSSNRKALLIKCGVCVAQQLTGVSVIIFYAQTIFLNASDSISPTIGTTIYFALYLIFSILGTVLVDKIGRKPLVLISIIGSGVSLLIVATYFYINLHTNIDTREFSIVPIITLIIYIMVFSVGLQNYPILIIGELFPTSVKAFAVSFSSIFYSILIAAVTKFFYFTNEAYGIHAPFFIFSASCFISLLFIIFVVPETKCKTLEDIQNDLKG